MFAQGREPAAPQHEKPAHRPAQHRPSKGKPAAHKPAQHKPDKGKPAAHKPQRRPSKPAAKGRKTAARHELDLIWFDDTEFRPLAQGGHIH